MGFPERLSRDSLRNMAIPNFQTLMLPVLKISAGGEVRIGEAVERLADQFHLSEEERSHLLPSGRQTTFANRVHWSKAHLYKAGLLESTRRGYFRISESGRALLKSAPDHIDMKVLERYPAYQEFRSRPAPEIAADDAGAEMVVEKAAETPDEIMRAAHRQIESVLAQDLLGRIHASPPAFFERLIVALLLKMGYGGSAADAGRALGRTGDDGVDGVIDQDALGLDRVYIQAKRYGPGNNIGAGAIRDFFGSLDRHKAAKGLFVTTSGFSSSAKDTAEFLSKRIVLIEGHQLARLMIRYDVGCRVEDVLHIKKVDEDFFE